MKLVNYKIPILFAVLFSYNSFAQISIVRGGNNGTLPQNFKSSGNYYYEDISNYLENFAGTWEYVNGNEKFQIVLTKVVKDHYINTSLNYNFYEDGIVLQYKKYVNNVLTFQSTQMSKPTFSTSDGIILDGYVIDYGRVTKTVYFPQPLGGGVRKQGGEYFHPDCIIEKLPKVKFEPHKIKFNLYMTLSMFGETSNEIYNGLPTFSIPNNIEMVKVN